MKPQVTKESLAQWIAELESQPHLSLREERYLAVMKYAQAGDIKKTLVCSTSRQNLITHNRAEIKSWAQIEKSTGELDALCTALRDSAVIALESLEAEPVIEVGAGDVLEGLFEIGTLLYAKPPALKYSDSSIG